MKQITWSGDATEQLGKGREREHPKPLSMVLEGPSLGLFSIRERRARREERTPEMYAALVRAE